MNLQEAQTLINENKEVLGKRYKKAVIDEIIIIPSNRDKLGDIIKQVLWEQEYQHLLFGYHDFTVIALLDFKDYPNSGFLFTEDLSRILESKKDLQ